MGCLAIILFAVVAAVGYGILHDLVTAHVCLEYFTVAHPRILPLAMPETPVVMALLWGVIATWWVGLILGIGLACVSQLGSRPKIGVCQVAPRVARLLVAMGGLALVFGIVGAALSRMGWIFLVPPLADHIPREHWTAFFFDAFAHTGSYLGGFLGGGLLIRRTWRLRKVSPLD